MGQRPWENAAQRKRKDGKVFCGLRPVAYGLIWF